MKKAKNINVEEFASSIKDNPKKIIAWARREILEYEALIKILEKHIPLTKGK